MKIIETEIPDVKMFEPKIFGDDRGFFLESYNKNVFKNLLGFDPEFVQDNHSHSTQGVLRGLHYQILNPQGKLIKITHGEVFDVAVDLRKGSATFGKWAGMHLTAENKRMAWIPPGFAHGFYVISERCDFLYKCTDFYNPAGDRCLVWNDSQVNIKWPFDKVPLLSPKDALGKKLEEADVFEEEMLSR